MSPTEVFPRFAGRWGVVMICLLAVGARAPACDIPVWQYALNMWGQDPYRVFYVHEGARPPGEAEALLKQAAETERANLTYEAVDVRHRAEASVEGKQVADRLVGEKLPTHVVVNPRGFICHTGLLSPEVVKRLWESPAQARLCEYLAKEQGGVLLVLSGEDEEDNRRVAGLAREAAERSTAEDRPVWWLEVRRDDPAEALFVAQLLSVEDDLAELRAPMVFVVFGRAHAMEPYVGRGINADAMEEMIAFLNGPCTCQIKEAGGGMDLLTGYDWQAQFGDRPAFALPSDPVGYVTFDTD